jgi:hypothetical protein
MVQSVAGLTAAGVFPPSTQDPSVGEILLEWTTTLGKVLQTDGPGVVGFPPIDGPGVVGFPPTDGPGVVGFPPTDGPGVVGFPPTDGPGVVGFPPTDGPGVVGFPPTDGPGVVGFPPIDDPVIGGGQPRVGGTNFLANSEKPEEPESQSDWFAENALRDDPDALEEYYNNETLIGKLISEASELELGRDSPVYQRIWETIDKLNHDNEQILTDHGAYPNHP